jgi:cell division protein FtsB
MFDVAKQRDQRFLFACGDGGRRDSRATVFIRSRCGHTSPLNTIFRVTLFVHRFGVGCSILDSGVQPNTGQQIRIQNDDNELDALEEQLDKTKAKGALETELQDTKARIDKLQEDLDELRSVSAITYRSRIRVRYSRLACGPTRVAPMKPSFHR